MANEGTGGMDQDVDTQITYDQLSSAHRQQESATRGNLVDDILNGALDGSPNAEADDLLADNNVDCDDDDLLV